MSNFLNVHYNGDNKLTHKVMNMFLYENNLEIPHRVRFSDAKVEDILRGECLIVKDDINQKAIYSNQRNLDKLMDELLQNNNYKSLDSNIETKKNGSKRKVKKLSK